MVEWTEDDSGESPRKRKLDEAVEVTESGKMEV